MPGSQNVPKLDKIDSALGLFTKCNPFLQNPTNFDPLSRNSMTKGCMYYVHKKSLYLVTVSSTAVLITVVIR